MQAFAPAATAPHPHSADPVLVGIGPAAAAYAYLAGVRHEVASRFDARETDFRLRPGGAHAALRRRA
ncbi:MAG TPA: hypothetical protein VFB42_04550 [Gaiellaceae bacterium]|nr:hypothetical protein [Gaiellaceae bacterium]